jgi:hypothetical protein
MHVLDLQHLHAASHAPPLSLPLPLAAPRPAGGGVKWQAV